MIDENEALIAEKKAKDEGRKRKKERMTSNESLDYQMDIHLQNVHN